MDWRDQGIVLQTRRHGEHDVIADVLTLSHGRHSGLIRAGATRRYRGILEPGNELELAWRARLESHLGHFTVEPKRLRAAHLLDRPGRLEALSAATALAVIALPEREGHQPVYHGLLALLDALEAESDQWGAIMVRWELRLLEDLGFGLDLAACVATGVTENLIYVSPKSGGAVSAGAGAPWRAKLLPLPGFLIDDGAGGAAPGDILDGFTLTGYFLDRHVLVPQNRKLPAARQRLIARLMAKIAGLNQIL